jgi:hypothetical protein
MPPLVPLFRDFRCHVTIFCFLVFGCVECWWKLTDWKETAMAYSTFYPGICLEELKETMIHFSQDNQCPGWNSNWAPPEYKFTALPLYHPAQFWTCQLCLNVDEMHNGVHTAINSVTEHNDKTLENTMKNTVFWVVMQCSSEKAQHFRGTHYLHLQGWRVRHASNQQM